MNYVIHRSDLGGITDVVTAGAAVATDPCLLQVAQLVGRLHDLEQAPVLPGLPAPPTTPIRGIGLCKAVTPLKAVIWVRERPWIIPVGAVAIIGGLIGIGYLMGSGPKRSSTRSTMATKGGRVNPSRRTR